MGLSQSMGTLQFALETPDSDQWYVSSLSRGAVSSYMYCPVERLHVPPGSVDYPLVWGRGDISRMSIPGPPPADMQIYVLLSPPIHRIPTSRKPSGKKCLIILTILEDSIRDMKSGWSVSLSTIWWIYQRIWGNRDLFLLVKIFFPRIQHLVFSVWYFMLTFLSPILFSRFPRLF